MSSRIEIDADEIFHEVMAQPAVRAAVYRRAARIATLARKDLVRAGIDAPVTIKERPLATGRVSLDVVCDAPEGAARRAGRIMRRAGRGAR